MGKVAIGQLSYTAARPSSSGMKRGAIMLHGRFGIHQESKRINYAAFKFFMLLLFELFGTAEHMLIFAVLCEQIALSRSFHASARCFP